MASYVVTLHCCAAADEAQRLRSKKICPVLFLLFSCAFFGTTCERQLRLKSAALPERVFFRFLRIVDCLITHIRVIVLYPPDAISSRNPLSADQKTVGLPKFVSDTSAAMVWWPSRHWWDELSHSMKPPAPSFHPCPFSDFECLSAWIVCNVWLSWVPAKCKKAGKMWRTISSVLL